MPELIAKSALDGRLKTIGSVTLREADCGPITSVALFAGGQSAADDGLAALDLAFPAPGTMATGKDGARIVWTGRDQAFVLGAVPRIAGAAVTDQTDGWTCLSVEGAKVADVLARLVPVDLRPAALPPGRAIRTGLNHMNVVLMRPAETRFEILVFRSMARTAFHEIAEAMATVAARG